MNLTYSAQQLRYYSDRQIEEVEAIDEILKPFAESYRSLSNDELFALTERLLHLSACLANHRIEIESHIAEIESKPWYKRLFNK